MMTWGWLGCFPGEIEIEEKDHDGNHRSLYPTPGTGQHPSWPRHSGIEGNDAADEWASWHMQRSGQRLCERDLLSHDTPGYRVPFSGIYQVDF